MDRRSLLAALPAFLIAQRGRAGTPQAKYKGAAPCRLARNLRLGVNIHPSYGDPGQVLRAMRGAGFDRYRVDATNSPMNEALAKAGFRGDFIVSDGPEPTGQLAVIRALERRFPGSVEFVEGKNEVNNHQTRFGRLTDTAGMDTTRRSAIKAYMTALNANVRADPLLSHVRVIDHSDLHPLFAAGDFINDHVYDGGANKSLWWWAPHEAELMDKAAPGRPMAVTEWGFRTGGDKAITAQQQAASLVEGFASLLHAGILVSYVYALRDDDEAYGIYSADWTPKPAVHALATLLPSLRDRGGRPSPSPLIVDARETDTRHLLVDRGEGRYVHLIWRPEYAGSTTLEWSYDGLVDPRARMLVSPQATLMPSGGGLAQTGGGYAWKAYEGGVLMLEVQRL